MRRIHPESMSSLVCTCLALGLLTGCGVSHAGARLGPDPLVQLAQRTDAQPTVVAPELAHRHGSLVFEAPGLHATQDERAQRRQDHGLPWYDNWRDQRLTVAVGARPIIVETTYTLSRESRHISRGRVFDRHHHDSYRYEATHHVR